MIFDLAIGPTSMCATLCRRSVLEVCMYESGASVGSIYLDIVTVGLCMEHGQALRMARLCN